MATVVVSTAELDFSRVHTEHTRECADLILSAQRVCDETGLHLVDLLLIDSTSQFVIFGKVIVIQLREALYGIFG
jgi:hypothetical protein